MCGAPPTVHTALRCAAECTQLRSRSCAKKDDASTEKSAPSGELEPHVALVSHCHGYDIPVRRELEWTENPVAQQPPPTTTGPRSGSFVRDRILSSCGGPQWMAVQSVLHAGTTAWSDDLPSTFRGAEGQLVLVRKGEAGWAPPPAITL